MRINRIALLLFTFLNFSILQSFSCTNFIVGKKASKDGSVMISYSADDYGSYTPLFDVPHAHHQKGEMRPLYHYESYNYLGEIPQVEETYRVVGLMNEYQLAIMETTFGGREELYDGPGIMDYGSLMHVALERCKTARQAITCMTTLANKYGYQSEGESFSIADKNEVWILELIGKGKNQKGIVWVARRVPDDCISGHANQSRIHKFPLNDKANCLYSKDVITFARKQGYFHGKDADFSFADAYCPAHFGEKRYCEARVWSFFNKWAAQDMTPYLQYAMGQDLDSDGKPLQGIPHTMPLWIQPKAPLTAQDLKNMMRDHYEGTPMDITTGLGAGPWNMPYRPTPLSFQVDGKTYFNERPISTQQTSAIYVAQLRSWLPDWVGGVLWYGQDDANMVALVPIYSCIEGCPDAFSGKLASATTFSFKSAYWLCNWVSNMVYYRYSLLFPELQQVRDRLENDYNTMQTDIETQAQQSGQQQGRKLLSQYCHRTASAMTHQWMQLAQRIIVKYNDMCVKSVDTLGNYLKTPGGAVRPVKRPGYPIQYRRRIIQDTGTRYLIP